VRIDERLLLPLPRFTKRLADLTLTIFGGILILPLIGAIACAIKFSSPGPVFYNQKRIGIGGRSFQAWKFRTMVVNAEQVLQEYLNRDLTLNAEWQRDHKLKNDPRVTWIGRRLRKTSLDELPQLWNVLSGEMSLVGPRPIVDAEIGKYGVAYRLYERVVPGITGFWQVSGRNNTTYQERVELDMRYIRNWSLWFDLGILIRTIRVVFLRDGAY
jgi:Undecaprenyl-phosphate galactose phosphotransferase WbaP